MLREVLTHHQLVVSRPLFAELEAVLHTKFGIAHEVISEFGDLLRQDAVLAEGLHRYGIDIEDKDDIVILSNALDGDAEIFVTGDREVLGIKQLQSLRIVSPREFWEIIKALPPKPAR